MSINQMEIARRAGVSQATVAFALNERLRSRVSVSTRKRILDIVNQSGYRPQRSAQMMRGKKSGLIGMIKTVGFMETAVRRSYSVANAIYNLGYRPQISDLMGEQGIRTACDTMIDERVEGIIFDGPVPDYTKPHLKRIQNAGIPIVTISGDRIPGAPHVALDKGQCTRELVQHLLSLGYRRLTMLMPEAVEGGYVACGFTERISAFREALAETALSEVEVVHLHLTPDNGEVDIYEIDQDAISRVLDHGRRPEVLLCSNDYQALSVLRACADRNIRVPQDIAITGFDNTNMGKHTSVSLTTIAQPSAAIAEKAVEVLLSLIQGKMPLNSDEVFKLPGQLIVRESCGAPESLRTASLQHTSLIAQETPATSR